MQKKTMNEILRITLMGTSGVGKTTLGRILKDAGWYHYSGDYRIATHYLREPIVAWLEAQFLQLPLFATLLRQDAIKIDAHVEVDNLAILSNFIGKLGKGGYDYRTFAARQRQFACAERAAMNDVIEFIEKSSRRGFKYFVNDAGGSLAENDDEELFAMLAEHTLLVYIHADDSLREELLARALRYPKPICYHEDFLKEMINSFAQRTNLERANLKNDNYDIADNFNDDEFIRFVTPNMLRHRHQRYAKIANKYGVIIDARELWRVRCAADFNSLIVKAVKQQKRNLCR